MNTVKIKEHSLRSGTVEIGFREELVENEYKVGDGATILYYSDRHPATIIDILDGGKTVVVQEDFSKRIDKNGMSDDQEYEYSRNENGLTHTFKRNRKGFYTDNGRATDYGTRLGFGYRRKYFDYSF